jgi:hypothetical protein
VVEPVVPAGLFDDDAGFGRFVEGVDEVVPDDALDELYGKSAADDRGGGKGLIRLRRKARQSTAHGFAHPLRQGALIPHAAAFIDVAQRLDEEEGVPARD